ncbi:hypothetical protein J6590_011749 [Homalodisca vitripennis]|nr:hypothetical protein J6590_011749 [Homalodisca vitripennis]
MADISSTDISDIILTSSWTVGDQTRNLENTLTFSVPSKSVGLEDVVQVNTCIHLIQDPESDDPCTITVKLPHTRDPISQSVIVSEAKIIELFGSCGEYLSTSVGEYVDDFEDCSVYLSTFSVKPPSREITYKARLLNSSGIGKRVSQILTSFEYHELFLELNNYFILTCCEKDADNREDTDKENTKNIAVISHAEVASLLGELLFYFEQQEETTPAEVLMLKRMRDRTARKWRSQLLQKTRHADKMWLYGINLQLVPVNQSLPVFSSINFQSVNEMLKEAKIPLSENAEKAKAFLQAHSGTLNNAQSPFKTRPPNPQMLMKMFEAGCFNPLGETGKNMSKCLSNLVPFLSRESAEPSETVPECDVSQISKDTLKLKDYINLRCTQLEVKIDRLEQIIRESEKKQNEKLDLIISLLTKQSS